MFEVLFNRMVRPSAPPAARQVAPMLGMRCRVRKGQPCDRRRLAVSYWKVIMSVRLSVAAFGFKGSFAKFALPEFKTL